MSLEITNSYSNVYESTYASRKQQTAEKTQTKEASSPQSESAKIPTSNKVSDYYSYLAENFDCVKNGNVAISGSFLRQCANDPEKAKYLEENLSLYNELRDQGYESAKQNAQKLGARLVNYSESWSIDGTGNITMTTSVTVTSDTKGWKELKEEQEKRLKEKKEKEEQEERLKEKKEKEKQLASNKTQSKETSAIQSENLKSSASSNVSDYYSYLSKNYDCVKNGNVAISSSYLRQCASDPEKAKVLEENLSLFKEIYDHAYKSAEKAAAANGGTLTSYSMTWNVDGDGNVSMMGQSTVRTETGSKSSKDIREDLTERLKEKRAEEKKSRRKKAEKATAEKKEEQERLEKLRARAEAKEQILRDSYYTNFDVGV